MPTADQYRRILARGWDVVGVSFYLDETRALEMVAEARRRESPRYGVATTGCLTPEVRHHFDRVFLGYAEEEIAQCWAASWSDWSIRDGGSLRMPFWRIVVSACCLPRGLLVSAALSARRPPSRPSRRASRWKAFDRCSRATPTMGLWTCSFRTRTGMLPGHGAASASRWRGTACSGRR